MSEDRAPGTEKFCADLEASVNCGARSVRVSRATTELFDLIVIGGGIHGVCVAKIAAQAGLSVLLLEQHDYASGTSSRSSKMAHGGLRYLEMFDFEQVFEGIRAREALFEKLPNLVRPERFLIPIPQGDLWLRCKLGVGLRLYDLFVRSKDRKHSWISGTPAPFGGHQKLAGCYQYTDGLMSDSRLVFEFLLAAQSFGCCALNYAEVSQIVQQNDTSLSVSWRDLRAQRECVSRARVVLNCAGPWAPQLHPSGGDKHLPGVRYSRGSHLVFSTPWRHPSLFLPLAEKGRYYFVWPHPSGTMVGTTEREVQDLSLDPVPSVDEIDEVLARLAKDLPDALLNRDTLHYAFAGVRTLPMRDSKRGVSQLSRKHIWSSERGVLTLLGGKYTTFAWTATEGVRSALELLGGTQRELPDPLAALPSALSDVERAQLCEELLRQYPSHPAAIARAVQRMGNFTLRYRDRSDAWSEIAPGVLLVELLHAFELEQAETVEDIVRRRLELEATSSHGIEALSRVESLLVSWWGQEAVSEQMREFRERMSRIDAICGK
jgi:glycerol-3-phosphate dehydrogenase